MRSAKLSSEVRSAWISFSASSWVTAMRQDRLGHLLGDLLAVLVWVVREVTLVVPTPSDGDAREDDAGVAAELLLLAVGQECARGRARWRRRRPRCPG